MTTARRSRPEWRALPVESGIKYLGIVEQIRNAIRGGALRAGDRLPTHREMAKDVGVTISTVTQAYAEAARLHLISGEIGRGTFVLADSADIQLFTSTASTPTTSSHVVDLSANTPAVNYASNDFERGLELLARGHIEEGYPSASTLLRGCLAFETLLHSQGVPRSANEIALTAGAQHALLVALLVVAGPGTRVLAEELTFPGLKAVARQLRIELVPVRMDEFGIIPADLDRQAKRTSATTLVCVPVLQNPIGASMDAERLTAIASVARRRLLTVIEDDVYRALTDRRSLSSELPEQTLLISSTSKTIEPALRLSAVSGPEHLLSPIKRETHMTSWMVSTPTIELFTRWVHDGTIERRIAWQRAEVEARWRIANNVFGRSTQLPAPHRFVGLTRSPDRIENELTHAGLIVATSTTLGIGPSPPKGLRLSLTAASSRAVLQEALVRTKAILGTRMVKP